MDNIDNSYFSILNKICLFLNIKLATRDRSNISKSYYIIRVENKNSTKILIDYIKKYPLLSSKRLDFIDWYNSFNLILNKKHLTKEGQIIILSNKNKMNDKRTNFNWEHLSY